MLRHTVQIQYKNVPGESLALGPSGGNGLKLKKAQHAFCNIIYYINTNRALNQGFTANSTGSTG